MDFTTKNDRNLHREIQVYMEKYKKQYIIVMKTYKKSMPKAEIDTFSKFRLTGFFNEKSEQKFL